MIVDFLFGISHYRHVIEQRSITFPSYRAVPGTAWGSLTPHDRHQCHMTATKTYWASFPARTLPHVEVEQTLSSCRHPRLFCREVAVSPRPSVVTSSRRKMKTDCIFMKTPALWSHAKRENRTVPCDGARALNSCGECPEIPTFSAVTIY